VTTQGTKDTLSIQALAMAAHGFSELLRYIVSENYMSDENAKQCAIEHLNAVVRTMGDIEGLF
jgi:hypothetical protein